MQHQDTLPAFTGASAVAVAAVDTFAAPRDELASRDEMPRDECARRGERVPRAHR